MILTWQEKNITDEFMESSIRIKDIATLVDQGVVNVVPGKRLLIIPLT